MTTTAYQVDTEWVRFVAWGRSHANRWEACVARRERSLRCGHCPRLHPYAVVQLGKRDDPADDTGNEGLLFDSWEDAAHQLRQWLPEYDPLNGWRERRQSGKRLIDPALPMPLEGREQAISFLLARSGKTAADSADRRGAQAKDDA